MKKVPWALSLEILFFLTYFFFFDRKFSPFLFVIKYLYVIFVLEWEFNWVYSFKLTVIFSFLWGYYLIVIWLHLVRCTVSLIISPSKVTCLYFLAAFEILVISLIICSFLKVCPAVYFIFILLKILVLS